ncbi:MAG: cbb3-type cytochrome c oxidase subunit I [Acidimicrobiales bacterium]
MLVVVGSWISGLGFYLTFWAWRKDNPAAQSPFIAMAGVLNAAMWQIATLGVAVSILTMLLPDSPPASSTASDPSSRGPTSGSPATHSSTSWLLPAYISWYGMLPKQVGGKLFSDSLARFAFWAFLVVSVPVGFHHQFVDPRRPAGVGSGSTPCSPTRCSSRRCSPRSP